MRLIDRKSVDLPHPEGPIIAVTAFSLISIINIFENMITLEPQVKFLVLTFPKFYSLQPRNNDPYDHGFERVFDGIAFVLVTIVKSP